MQNPDHGFGSYEKARTGSYLELLNPAEIFDRCMVEYSYPECTAAILTALSLFRKHYPSHAEKQVDSVIQSAIKYLKSSQRPDGSWYGSWGICFTYGAMFALEMGRALGEFRAPTDVGHEESQVVNTAWAVLGLMAARYPDRAIVARELDVSANQLYCDHF